MQGRTGPKRSGVNSQDRWLGEGRSADGRAHCCRPRRTSLYFMAKWPKLPVIVLGVLKGDIREKRWAERQPEFKPWSCCLFRKVTEAPLLILSVT